MSQHPALRFPWTPGSGTGGTSDPAEFRDLARRRVLLLLAIMFGLWGAVWIANVVVTVLFFPDFGPGKVDSPRSLVHAATVLCMGGTWAGLRTFWKTGRRLALVDSAVMASLAVAVAAMLWLGDPRYRPEFVGAMALSQILVLRAALVPAPALRTALLGAFAAVPLTVAAWLVHAGPTAPAGLPVTAPGAAAVTAVWCGISVTTTTAISWVIYGLHREVREAQRLGQYTLERRIGQGGMGEVFLARHALLKRLTAVKILPESSAQDEAIVRFEREVQLTSQLSHPNIVAIYDFGRSTEGLFYYAMEYVSGVDLETLVREDGPQPAARVRHILLQAARALAEAHAVPLIHRDVKPGNILLSDSDRRRDHVKLVDFGLAKLIQTPDSALSEIHTIKGTPLYLAPEAIRSPDELDGRSDLYALGAVGYFLLAGQPVFAGSTTVEVCSQHLLAEPIPPSVRLGIDVPADLEAVVMQCLAKRADDRPASAHALVGLLEQARSAGEWTTSQADAWWESRGGPIRSARHSAMSKPLHGRTLDVRVDGLASTRLDRGR